ncbi:MAG: ACT domain-containing protein [Candidatus Delongbacteria bacterium]|nr:ACT domain-containing protein [Candidatus Delongbacteria bacterium]
MELHILPDSYSIYRFDPGTPVPSSWWVESPFVSITRTPDELSVVCRSCKISESTREESGRRLLRIRGPLDFSLTGVISSLSQPLAEAGIAIFVISTYDTDYLMVKQTQLDHACRVLSEKGHTIAILKD